MEIFLDYEAKMIIESIQLRDLEKFGEKQATLDILICFYSSA